MMRLLLVVVFESFVKNLLEFSRAGIKFLSRAMSKNSSSDALLKCPVKPFVLGVAVHALRRSIPFSSG